MILTTSQPSLSAAARPGPLGRAASASMLEWGVLLGVGALAALLTAYLALGLRLPGHAILRVVVPMVVGMALVPRRGAGLVMTLGAAATGAVIRLTDTGELPIAAFAGLVLVGPLLDLAALGGRSGRHLYLRFALAGMAANLLVYAVRWGVTVAGWETSGGGENFRRLGLVALGSFLVCGMLAGLLGAALAFRPTSDDAPRA